MSTRRGPPGPKYEEPEHPDRENDDETCQTEAQKGKGRRSPVRGFGRLLYLPSAGRSESRRPAP